MLITLKLHIQVPKPNLENISVIEVYHTLIFSDVSDTFYLHYYKNK